MTRYTLKVQYTDRFLKKGKKDYTKEFNGTLDECRVFIHSTYFRNPQLRTEFYQVYIFSNGKEVGCMFPFRLQKDGKPTSLVYVFTGPNYNIRSPTYVVDQKTGKIIGELGYRKEQRSFMSIIGKPIEYEGPLEVYIKRR